MKKLENAQKYLKISMLIIVVSQLIPFIIENTVSFIMFVLIPMIVYFCVNKKYKFAAIPSALFGTFWVVISVAYLILNGKFVVWSLIYGLLMLIPSILYTIAVYKK